MQRRDFWPTLIGGMGIAQAGSKFALNNENHVGRENVDPITTPSEVFGGTATTSFTQSGTGAVPREVEGQLRLLPLFPENFGAVGDGSANDTTAMQDALNEGAASGRPVYLATGKTYLISASLTCATGTHICGHGKIKVAARTIMTGAVLRAIGVSGIDISEIEIDCNADNGGGNYAIWITGGMNHRIEGIYVHDTAQAGICLEEISRFIVQNNRIIDCGRAIRVQGGTATDNHGMMLIALGKAAISDGVLSGNIVERAHRKGIATYARSTGIPKALIVAGNMLSACGLGGIFLASAPGGAKLTDITVTGNVVDGCYTNYELARVAGAVVIGNASTGALSAGFSFSDVDDLVISGNKDKNSGTHGLNFSVTNATFTASIAGTVMTVTAIATGAMMIEQGLAGAGVTPGTKITDVLTGNGGLGTYRVSVSQSVANAKMTAAAPPNSNLSITGNVIRRPNRSAAGFAAGIRLLDTIASTIAGNNVSDSPSGTLMTYGIIEQGASDNNRISGNLVDSATSASCLIIGAASTLLESAAGHHGFGVAVPRNTLDIAGGLSFVEQGLMLVNGANQNVALPPNAGIVIISGPTGLYSIGGIAGGHAGRIVEFVNYTTVTLTLTHQDASSFADNRLLLSDGENVTVPSLSSIRLVYSALAGNSWMAFR